MTSFKHMIGRRLQSYGAEPSAWPLFWRMLLPLLLRVSPALAKQWQQTAQEQQRWQAMMQGLPDLSLNATLQARLAAISALPQQRPAVKPEVLPYLSPRLWQMSMAATTASLVLGFVLGAGGYIAPVDYLIQHDYTAPAGTTTSVDGSADYDLLGAGSVEASDWLMEGDE